MDDQCKLTRRDPSSLLTALDAAQYYTSCKWSVIPVPYRTKIPILKGWQQLRLSADQLKNSFGPGQQNIGVLMGEPSEWLIDIDLDNSVAVELAPQFLPPTGAIFGRPSKPRSHYLYISTTPCSTQKFKTRNRPQTMLVEFRSTGQQTVLPPSIHQSGEPIRWATETITPAVIDPAELLAAVKKLVAAVKVRLGEQISISKSTVASEACDRSIKGAGSDARSGATPVADCPDRCLDAMFRLQMSDNNDGSARLYACACRVVEHDLDDSSAVGVFEKYSRQRPFARDWTSDEFLQRIRDAEKVCERGSALAVDDDGCVKLGQRDPRTGRLVLSPRRTLPTAEALIREFHAHPDGPTLIHYAGSFWEWIGNRYAEIEDGSLSQTLLPWLHKALRYTEDKRVKKMDLVPFDANPGTVSAALESVRTYTHIAASTKAPAWRWPKASDLPASELLVCRSKIWHLPSGEALTPSPRLFTFNALDFDLDPDAPDPLTWFDFLYQLFGDDLEAQQLLQEWFGYCLIADTSLQKMLLIVGPKRSGKGTIARVLRRLIGLGNVCGPTTSSLAGPFGLQPLLSKSLAIVSDARFHGDSISIVVERLLCISGEDVLTIDRKFKDSVTGKLPTRFLFLTNELPRLNDSSGALAGRFLMLQLTKSFYGQEDHQLEHKLLAELSGILKWAIEGWHRLHQRGRFIQPQSVAESMQELEYLGSPVKAFVGECCRVSPGLRIDTPDLYDLWKRWCERVGREHSGTQQTFGRDLQAAVPGIKCRKGTGDKRFYEGISAS